MIYVGNDRIHIHVQNGEKMQNSGVEIVAGLTPPLRYYNLMASLSRLKALFLDVTSYAFKAMVCFR